MKINIIILLLLVNCSNKHTERKSLYNSWVHEVYFSKSDFVRNDSFANIYTEAVAIGNHVGKFFNVITFLKDTIINNSYEGKLMFKCKYFLLNDSTIVYKKISTVKTFSDTMIWNIQSNFLILKSKNTDGFVLLSCKGSQKSEMKNIFYFLKSKYYNGIKEEPPAVEEIK